MMELWGAESCEECKLVKEWLSRTPLEWKYVDVANTTFEGVIPRVVDEGQHITGFPRIQVYVRQKLKKMGFPDGMI